VLAAVGMGSGLVLSWFLYGGLRASVWRGAHARGLLGAYWAGIPLLGSPGVPLRSPRPFRQPRILFEQGGGGLGGYVRVLDPNMFRPALHPRRFVGRHWWLLLA
jgi:hypothetical protein